MKFKDSALEKIAAFLRSIPEEQLNHATQCFPRALRAMCQQKKPVTVVYYDGDTTIRVGLSDTTGYDHYVQLTLDEVEDGETSEI
ncbi:MAG: hypothetical protein II622_04570 [Thermoguttaceae bacterium]|nr:hypothetical protein [Thermoguttaceae bacterium]